MHTNKIDWEFVEPWFQTFTVTVNRLEMRWYRRAWQLLEDAGMTAFHDEIEKQWVLLRAVTIGLMYLGFWRAAWDEPFDADAAVFYCPCFSGEAWGAEESADEFFCLDPLRLGNLLPPGFMPTECESYQLLTCAILTLVQECRQPVFDALVNGFRGESRLFFSLWFSSDVEIDLDDLEIPGESMLNEVTDEKLAGFAYVTEGMDF